MGIITYELAKQLKDARFPESKSDVAILDEKTGITYYHPTLSKLIEACGKDLYSLQHCLLDNMPGEWYVISSVSSPNGKRNDGPVFYSNTPEEAVARLWLALNDK